MHTKYLIVWREDGEEFHYYKSKHSIHNAEYEKHCLERDGYCKEALIFPVSDHAAEIAVVALLNLKVKS